MRERMNERENENESLNVTNKLQTRYKVNI